jgi:hypothetical protein
MISSESQVAMTNEPQPKPDLSEHEEEAEPFDDVMRKLLTAKPSHKAAETPPPKPGTK